MVFLEDSLPYLLLRNNSIIRGTGTHPSGVTGVSVECAVGLSVTEIATAIPHGQIGITTVGAVRQAGGDVVRTTAVVLIMRL